MKASELRLKSKTELNALLSELSTEQFKLRMQKSTGQLTKPDQVKKGRRDIARIQFILNEMAGA